MSEEIHNPRPPAADTSVAPTASGLQAQPPAGPQVIAQTEAQVEGIRAEQPDEFTTPISTTPAPTVAPSLAPASTSPLPPEPAVPAPAPASVVAPVAASVADVAMPAPASSPAPAPAPVVTATVADVAAAEPAPAGTAGQILRHARETRGLTVEVLADTLKVPAAKLKALEADDWARLPDVVFARSLALSVCRVLQQDSAPVLALLPKGGATRLTPHPEGLNQPLREASMRDRPMRHTGTTSSMAGTSSTGGGWKLWALAILLLAGAAVLAGMYWGPQWWDDIASKTGLRTWPATASVVAPSGPADGVAAHLAGSAGAASTSGAAGAPAASALVPGATAEGAVAGAVDDTIAIAAPDAAALMPGVDATVATAAVAQAGATGATGATGAVAGAAATQAGSPIVPALPPSLRIRAVAQVRVQVNDFQRNMAAEQVLQPGEVFETTSTHLTVTIDKASAAWVEVHGAAYDLSRVTQNNVARFELK